MLKHKKDVYLKDVCDTKKCVCHKHLLTTCNTKKCVCLEGNKSWLEDARKEKRCWVISESNLSQIWVSFQLDLTSSNQFWHIHNTVWLIFLKLISILTCLNIIHESHLQSSSILWIHFHRRCINVDQCHILFNWHNIVVVYLVHSVWSSVYSSSFIHLRRQSL